MLIDYVIFFVLKIKFVGIGSGFSRISCLVVGSQYFEKNFSIFAGIIYSGFSMGRVIFSPVTEIISIEYGYKNTLFLIGGLCLNVCVGALLFEPVKKHFALQKIGNEIGSNLEKVITSDPELESLNSKCNGEVKKSCDIADVSNKNDVKTLSKSSSANGTVVVCQGKEEPEVEKLLKTSHSNTQHGATETDSTKELVEIKTPSSQEQQQHVSNNKNLHRKKSYKCLKALRNSIDISLLKEQIFYIVCASSILNYLTIMYANVFLVPLCLEKGLSPIQASLVVSAKSGVEVMGRLGGPWVQRFIKQDAVLLYIIICIAVSVCFLGKVIAELTMFFY